jgi:hypothetical protein
MSVAEVYEASPLNPPRRRAGRDEMEERARFLVSYAEEHGPVTVTVRGLYYRAEVRGVPGIGKTDAGYDKVQRQVLNLRRCGRLPYDQIADLTRWMRKPTTHDSIEAALQDTARHYRKALWRDADTYVEIWCEKDALAGTIMPVTEEYDVPLMVSRGFSSETFCFEAIASQQDDPRRYHIWYLGDLDRAGCDAAKSLKEKLFRFGAEMDVDVGFKQLAIEPSDVLQFDESHMSALVNLNGETEWLPARVPKRQSPADKKWPYPYAIELDAIEPDDLRRMARRDAVTPAGEPMTPGSPAYPKERSDAD